ncbi:hypothetical protein MRB53_010094 [Persea americana]|uniref:Uncharacterized protein n=1 Tax=Persea americana TaxID=3435 RepID=A0ACC2LR05_PERAE|nr:hypothetical protein MRB53_010094 [Persea americana]
MIQTKYKTTAIQVQKALILKCLDKKLVIVSLGSGPLDQLAGGGNSPAFSVAAVAALIGGLGAILGLPRSQTERL